MYKSKKPATLVDALIPILSLIVMLAASVALYGEDSSYGANQIALILAASIALLVGFKNGYSWEEMEEGIVSGISMSLGAILILLMVGLLIGTWVLSGTVPTMIYYGMQILEPDIFYAATCIICALVSVSIGSSWTTAGTIGIALIGIASGLGMSLPITAGAIISGAYFGDKMSPLSDTTNLAPAIVGSDLFSHIRHMTWTTGPSILIAIIIFSILGFIEEPTGKAEGLKGTLTVLNEAFTISVISLIPLFAVLVLAYKKMPAFPTLLIGALIAAIISVVLQSKSIESMVESSVYSCVAAKENIAVKSCSFSSIDKEALPHKASVELLLTDGKKLKTELILNDNDESQVVRYVHQGQALLIHFKRRAFAINAIDAIWQAMATGYVSNTGDEVVDRLLTRGGMLGMLNPTVWLILCAMTFGAVLEKIGLLQRVVVSTLTLVKGTGSLVATVIGTCIGTNLIAGDQYIALVLPGRMYRAEFKKRGLQAKNLSRVLEDSATITSPLIPWNTCGAYMAGTLGIPTLAYLPFCFFNLINPVVSIIYGVTHFKIVKIEENSDDDSNCDGLLVSEVAGQ